MNNAYVIDYYLFLKLLVCKQQNLPKKNNSKKFTAYQQLLPLRTSAITSRTTMADQNSEYYACQKQKFTIN